VTTSQGGDGGRRPVGPRHRGAPGTEAPAHKPDRARFVTVVRGYDRIEVDGYVGEVDRLLSRLRSDLADADERRRRAEQRIETLENENRSARARLDAAAAPPEEGFGVRAERLLRLAEQEAAEVRSGAAEEAAMMRQRVREDIERQRHEAEQALIMRSTQFDERASQRTSELQRREQQIAEQLTAARGEAEALQAAARRAADQYRQRVEADVEEVKARVGAEVAQIREQAAQELDRLTTLESGVRSELVRLSARLSAEVARPVPTADGATGRATENGAKGNGANGGDTNGNGANGNGATAGRPQVEAGADGGAQGSPADRDEPAPAGEAHR
jgi:cell division septum initiation protein DivIVA